MSEPAAFLTTHTLEISLFFNSVKTCHKICPDETIKYFSKILRPLSLLPVFKRLIDFIYILHFYIYIISLPQLGTRKYFFYMWRNGFLKPVEYYTNNV